MCQHLTDFCSHSFVIVLWSSASLVLREKLTGMTPSIQDGSRCASGVDGVDGATWKDGVRKASFYIYDYNE